MSLNQSIAARATHVAPRFAGLALCAGVAMAALPARALVINVTYDPDVPAAAETAFNSAIASYENLFTNNITVNVTLSFGTAGLGENTAQVVTVSYADWRAAVAANAAANPANTFEAAALASLPASDPLGNGTVELKTAEARALGLTNAQVTGQSNVNGVNPPIDDAITISNAQSYEYNGVATSGLYDFTDIATHELNEGLGIGSVLTGIANNGGLPTTDFTPEDYFRYACGGGTSRDITTDPNANVCFSFDGGLSDVAQFNQDNSAAGNNGGVDRNDWFWPGSCAAEGLNPLVQDAITCTGQVAPLLAPGTAEFETLSTLGYDAAAANPPAVPEPSSLMLLFSGGLLGFAAVRRFARQH